MADYVVQSACVVAKNNEGRDVYLYRDDVVPAGIPAPEIKRLAGEGFLAAVKATPDGPDGPDGKKA